jgi:hypothetical protein
MADHEREINDDEGMIDGDAVIRRQSGTLTVVLGTAHETDEAMPMTPRKAEPRHAGVEMTSSTSPCS